MESDIIQFAEFLKKRHFTRSILLWFKKNNRKLIWRDLRSPYNTYISEIMLQQTTVGTVEKKFPIFIKKYPNFKSFSKSSEKELLSYWSGLGYYRRARNLWNAVNTINTVHKYKIPSEKNLLMNLPGVGIYTSSAIRTIGYNIPDTPVDINIYRLFSGLYGTELSHKQIEEILKFIWPKNHSRNFTEALMDLASIIKKKSTPKVNNLDLTKYLFANNQKKIYLIKTKKKLMKKININFFIIKYKNQIAFLKKPNLSFFSGFEHLPNNKDLLTNTLSKNNKLKKIKDIKYVITNHNLQISVFEIVMNSKNKKFKWHKSVDLIHIPLPTLYKKILSLIS
mgnify:FL=1|jgi:A/G-specific adenine glycosylase|tara:strand:+ start:5722 stop:6732 length:1011 start_codon:yes stop_codon:yes gene_type:complete